MDRFLALTSLVTRIGLVDDIGTSLATHDFAIGVALLEGLQRIGDFHNIFLNLGAPVARPLNGGRKVGISGAAVKKITDTRCFC